MSSSTLGTLYNASTYSNLYLIQHPPLLGSKPKICIVDLLVKVIMTLGNACMNMSLVRFTCSEINLFPQTVKMELTLSYRV